MLKSTSTCVFVLWTALAAQAETPARWSRLLTVEAHAFDKKNNGQDWDQRFDPFWSLGIGLFPTIMTQGPSAAPDLMICVTDGENRQCHHHAVRRNLVDVPISLCPNNFQCRFNAVPVPEGVFGILAVDLDFFGSHDFVFGAVLTPGGSGATADTDSVDRDLIQLARELRVIGAPPEYPVQDIELCLNRTCRFPSPAAGVLSLEDPSRNSCPFATEFELQASAISGATVEFAIGGIRSRCRGKLVWEWDPGDGHKLVTEAPALRYNYAASGTHTISVTPRCIRELTACQGEAKKLQIRIP
jgi:hypothetical protein